MKGILVWLTAISWIILVISVDGISLSVLWKWMTINMVLTFICTKVVKTYEEINKISLNKYIEKLWKL